MSLRIIVKRTVQPASSGQYVDTTWHTFVIEAPEVEEFLRGGGMNPDSFDLRVGVGIETFANERGDNP